MKTGKISFVGLFLSLFFGVVIFTILFLVCNITAQPFFEIKLLFAIINICIVIVLGTGAGALASKITVPMFTTVSMVTAVYTIIQFVILGTSFYSDSINYYVVSQLILLFVYFLVSLPIAKAGYNLANKN